MSGVPVEELQEKVSESGIRSRHRDLVLSEFCRTPLHPPKNPYFSGCFGAALMKSPELVRDIVHSISRAVQVPVTVKMRIGVDEFDSPEFTQRFVRVSPGL